MKNSLNRDVPYNPYQGVKPVVYQKFKSPKNMRFEQNPKPIYLLEELIDSLDIQDGMTLSFHHHLRNGDDVMNRVMKEIAKKGVKNITLFASSIFPVHAPLVEYIEKEVISKIYTAYVAGPVAKAISQGKLKDVCIMHTHGYRATLLMSQEVLVDYAFIATPSCDLMGNMSGSVGPSSCGVLGYAHADAQYARYVIAITDFISKDFKPEISGHWVDCIATVDKIGDREGIVSGTTQITRDPVGLQIARMTAELMMASGYLKNGFSFQTGAGGISLAVAQEVYQLCLKHQIKGSFASGGITSFLVKMLEEGIFEKLYDVQSFDLVSVDSVASNPDHIKISAAQYADIYTLDNIVNQLDFVILGATEIDLDFNVNVTTGSDGILMGGSGGHADTAYGAKLTIIVSKLVSSRLSVITDRVTTVTTPGETVDVLVTDRGIAINPKHQELISTLKKNTSLPIFDIHTLYQKALAITGFPEKIPHHQRVVGLSMYRDGTILDSIYQIEEE